MDNLVLIGTVIGGLGLFLLAIGMMTDGLKLAAGSALRAFLAKWSSTPLKGIFSGALMTAIVQSSSAVTVASLGFVNAGLLSMRHALGIIYGANIGTTMTGWLVVIVGFKFNIQAFALPMIGMGMLLKLVKPKSRLASVGMALAGFGLFFVGIDTLKLAFEGMVSAFDLSQLTATGLQGFFLYLSIGVVMTVLTQSSSASIALTITAATSGIIGLYAAGAMVIGANIGTTSTALLASIGATSSAKRLATAQVLFNVVTAIVAGLILPLLLSAIGALTQWLAIETNPGIILAIFHTLFNVLGVLLIFPFNDKLASFLERRFTSVEEKAARPKYLDKNIAQTPDLAVNALILEVLSISDRFLALYPTLISRGETPTRETEHSPATIIALCNTVSQFIVDVERSALNADTTHSLASLMRVEHYIMTCTQKAQKVLDANMDGDVLKAPELDRQVIDFFAATNTFLRMVRWRQYENVQALELQFSLLNKEHHTMKSALVMGATQGHISVEKMSNVTDCMENVLQIAQLWLKAFERIQQIESSITTLNENQNEESDAALAN